MEPLKKENTNHWLTAPYEPMPSDPSIKRTSLIYLAYLIIPSFMLGFITVFALALGMTNVANIVMIATIVGNIAVLLLYKPIFKQWPHNVLKKPTTSDVKLAFKSYGILLIGNAILSFIPSPVPENQAVLEETMGAGNLILFGLFTIVFAPIIEEFLFRHVFFKVFGSRVKEKSALPFIANIIIFTLLHTGNPFVNPMATVQYAWLSGVFAYSYAKSRSIEAPIILHVLNNAIAYVALILVGLMG